MIQVHRKIPGSEAPGNRDQKRLVEGITRCALSVVYEQHGSRLQAALLHAKLTGDTQRKKELLRLFLSEEVELPGGKTGIKHVPKPFTILTFREKQLAAEILAEFIDEKPVAPTDGSNSITPKPPATAKVERSAIRARLIEALEETQGQGRKPSYQELKELLEREFPHNWGPKGAYHGYIGNVLFDVHSLRPDLK